MGFTGYTIRTGLMLVTMLACVVCWGLIPRPRKLHFTLFGALAIIASVTELTGFILTLAGRLTYYVYNAYALVELLVVMGIVARVDRGLRHLAWGVSVAGAAGLVVNAWVDGSFGPALFEGILLASVLQAMVLMVLLWRMAIASVRPLQKVPEFWLLMGLLIYFGGMAPFFALIKYVYANDRDVANVLWTLMPFLCIIRYAMGAWSCVLQRRDVLQGSHGQ